MRLRNNSKREWLQYHAGKGEMVDILPESEFECSDEAGRLILKNLGSPAWVTEILEPLPVEPVVEEKVVEKKPKKEVKKKKILKPRLKTD